MLKGQVTDILSSRLKYDIAEMQDEQISIVTRLIDGERFWIGDRIGVVSVKGVGEITSFEVQPKGDLLVHYTHRVDGGIDGSCMLDKLKKLNINLNGNTYKTGDYHIKHEVLIYGYSDINKKPVKGQVHPGDMIDHYNDSGITYSISAWDKAVAANSPIISLKRLADGAEFTIGDEVDVASAESVAGKVRNIRASIGKIKKFYFINGRLKVDCGKKQAFLSAIELKRTWYVGPKFRPTFTVTGAKFEGPGFSSREAVQRHIIETSPCFSLSEVLAVTGRTLKGPYGRKLEKLAKEKLRIFDAKHKRYKTNTLTPDRRKEIAKKAIAARWSGEANQL